jgi:hypothetical protein
MTGKVSRLPYKAKSQILCVEKVQFNDNGALIKMCFVNAYSVSSQNASQEAQLSKLIFEVIFLSNCDM